MLKVNVINEHKEVKAGQVRYDSRGMIVLIISGEKPDNFDAIVLNEGFVVKPFDFNSFDITAKKVLEVYPFLAQAELNITK